jgi:lipopolysaccharide export system protein LptA
MDKQLTKTLKTSLSIFALSCSVLFSAHAEKADLSKEININASRQAADLKSKIFSYIDNVVITQGSLIIKADLVQVMADNKTDEKTYIAQGKPATFTQTLEDGTPIYLQANEIKYQPDKNMVVISGHAELRQEGSKVKGSIITYNFLTEQVCANCENSNSNERVNTVLQPKELDKKK